MESCDISEYLARVFVKFLLALASLAPIITLGDKNIFLKINFRKMSLEDLQIEVEEKLATVSSTLEALKSQLQLLTENGDKLKQIVKETVNGHAKDLRTRERQIIRQIEVVTAHQKSILEIQIARIIHTKGSLFATKSLLSQCEPEDTTTLARVRKCHLPSVKPIQHLELVNVQLEGNSLASEILEFGKISIPDTITHQHSTVLPARMEEYEDSEHEVLHKSLCGSTLTSSMSGLDSTSPIKIKVSIPKLPNSSWLAPSPSKNNKSESERSSTISSWLNNFHLSQSVSDDLFEKEHEGFQMIRLPSRVRESESSSIEIIPQLDMEDFKPEDEQVKETMYSRWLKQQSVDSVQENVPNSLKYLEKNTDADNYSKWLSSWGIRESNSSNFTSIDETVTKAKNLTLSHMISILKSDQINWLKKCPIKNEDRSPLFDKVNYSPRSKVWLQRGVTVKDGPDNIELPDSSKIWLLRKYLSKTKKESRQNKEQNPEGLMADETKPKQSSISFEDVQVALSELEELLPKHSSTPVIHTECQSKSDYYDPEVGNKLLYSVDETQPSFNISSPPYTLHRKSLHKWLSTSISHSNDLI